MLKQISIVTDQKILRQKSEPVCDINNPEIQELIEAMFEIMKKKKGAGLAAIQTGKLIRLFVIDYKNEKLVFINPEIKKLSKRLSIIEEGCLSVPGTYFEISRPSAVEIEATDRYGKKFRLKEKNMLARIIQHEMDHLNGVLFVDKV